MLKHNNYSKFRIEFLFVFLCICLFCLSSSSEIAENDVISVKTFVSQDSVHPGDSFKIAFRVSIAPGFHINAQEVDDEYLIPTDLFIDETSNIKVLKQYYPEPVFGRFDYSEEELQIYEGEILLAALIKVDGNIKQKKHTLTAKLLYQPCNDRSCMRENTLDLKIVFKVVPPSKKTKEINEKIFTKIDLDIPK